MEKKGLLEKIQYYINAEENCLDSEIRVAKKSKNIIHSFNLDEIFWPEENNLEEYKPEHISHEKDFWNENKDLLYDLLEKNQITNSDFLILKDAITIIRWKYFMDDNYQTIDKEYQDMCKFFVKLQLKYNDIWILNFLRYINHESWYYKRVKALTLFRLLSNPKQEIIWVRDEICSFLYDSIKVEPDSYEIAQNILKEYIEKVFTIACTTYDSRIEFISGWDNNWNIRCWNNEFVDWLRKYINWEKIDSETISIEDHNDEEIVENLKSKLKEKEDETEQIKKEQEAILQKQKELEEQLDKIKVSYNEDLKKKELENAELQAKISLLQQANEISKQKETKEDIIPSTEDLEEKRSYYRILIVWWSDKANKKYNNLLKNWFNWELFKRFKIKPEQLWELYGDYNKQKTQKDFAKKIENDLLLWNIDFVVALQTDHETWLYKLLNNGEFLSRITYFAEREENNQNPKYSDQSFTEDRFYYYLWRAIEKFERAENNSIA